MVLHVAQPTMEVRTFHTSRPDAEAELQRALERHSRSCFTPYLKPLKA